LTFLFNYGIIITEKRKEERKMTVKDLIEELKKYDEDYFVHVAIDEESDGVDFEIEEGAAAIFFVAKDEDY
jgi:hypothetical protein